MSSAAAPSPRTIEDYIASASTLATALAQLTGQHERGVQCENVKLSWSEVILAAHQRVHQFSELRTRYSESSGPPHIGLLLNNSPEFVFWLCAAAISPIVAVGLNDTRSATALARDVKTADCALVIYDDEHRNLAEELTRHASCPVIDINSASTIKRVPAKNVTKNAAKYIRPDDLLALIFTSGTSGDPKAVRVTHRKITAPAQMLAERFDIGPSDCIYNAMPMFHSNALLVAWPLSVLTGANLALRPKFSASRWLHDVRRYRATFANYVGAPLSYILATPEQPDDCDNPMRIVYGNEAPPQVRKTFARRFAVRVVDGFGSTEGGIAISRTAETPPDALGPLPSNAAVLMLGTEEPCSVAQLSASGEVLNPDEAIGELVGDGPGLFAGYYNDPGADTERMRGGRYRSGDLVYVDSEGFVYFAGRAATWMRVRGENLAAAPIERAIARHPEIAEVTVYGVQSPDAPGDDVAAAVVLSAAALRTAAGSVADAATNFARGLRDFLSAQEDLAPRQWPRYVRITDALPRTASFKIRTSDLAKRSTTAADDVLLERQGGAPAEYR